MYLYNENPVALRFRVWYLLGIHFVSRGCEFHHQLTKNSLKFDRDENGTEFITIAHETHQKNYQGGLEETDEEAQDKRMYATGTERCPIKSLKHFLSKSDPNAVALFNECDKEVLRAKDASTYEIWYTSTPVKQKKFSSFMIDICKNAGATRYTAHSLRSTAITAMSDAGLTDRNIMFMSDHKCEESLKSYCRRPSTEQKKMISSVLGNVASGEKNLPVIRTAPNPVHVSAPEMAQNPVHVVPAVTATAQNPDSILTSATGVLTSSQSLNINRETSQLSGFGAHSMFKDCHFHFHAQ